MPVGQLLLQWQTHGTAPFTGQAVLDFILEYFRESFRHFSLVQRLIAQLAVKLLVERQVSKSCQGERRQAVFRRIFSGCVQQMSSSAFALMPILDRQFDDMQRITIIWPL